MLPAPASAVPAPRLADPAPVAFGLFGFTLLLFAVRFAGVSDTTITGPTSAALDYAILAAGAGQALGGVLALIRGDAFTGWVTTTFGIWLVGFFLLIMHVDEAAAGDKGIISTGANGKALPAPVVSALQGANETAWHADSLAWYVLVLLVPIAIFAIKSFRERNTPFMIAFGAVIVTLLTLGLGMHHVYSEVTAVTRGTAAAPDLGSAVHLLRISGWSALVCAVGIFWIFVQHVYPAAGEKAAVPALAPVEA